MNVRGYRIGAAVFCKGAATRVDLVRGAQPAFALQPAPFLSCWECDIYLPDASAPAHKSTQ